MSLYFIMFFLASFNYTSQIWARGAWCTYAQVLSGTNAVFRPGLKLFPPPFAGRGVLQGCHWPGSLWCSVYRGPRLCPLWSAVTSEWKSAVTSSLTKELLWWVMRSFESHRNEASLPWCDDELICRQQLLYPIDIPLPVRRKKPSSLKHVH